MWTCRSTRPAGARLARPRAPAAAFAGRAYARPARATFAASKADVAKTSAYQPASAKDAIERGLKEFKENKNYEEALRLFEASMKMKPNQDEALAAMYNMGCTYAKLKEWKKSADAIVSAINDHNLKLSVAIKVNAAFVSNVLSLSLSRRSGACTRPPHHTRPNKSSHCCTTRHRTTTCVSCATGASGSTR